MPLYIKKPKIIEAWVLPESFSDFVTSFPEVVAESGLFFENGKYRVTTLEGTMSTNPTNYLVKGIAGEFYFCEKKIFEELHEPFTELLAI